MQCGISELDHFHIFAIRLQCISSHSHVIDGLRYPRCRAMINVGGAATHHRAARQIDDRLTRRGAVCLLRVKSQLTPTLPFLSPPPPPPNQHTHTSPQALSRHTLPTTIWVNTRRYYGRGRLLLLPLGRRVFLPRDTDASSALFYY